TKLCSIRTTSAVITSPVRISERCSDSSNRAAKDSDIKFPCTSPRFPAANAKSRTAVSRTGTAVVAAAAAGYVDEPYGLGAVAREGPCGPATFLRHRRRKAACFPTTEAPGPPILQPIGSSYPAAGRLRQA